MKELILNKGDKLYVLEGLYKGLCLGIIDDVMTLYKVVDDVVMEDVLGSVKLDNDSNKLNLYMDIDGDNILTIYASYKSDHVYGLASRIMYFDNNDYALLDISRSNTLVNVKGDMYEYYIGLILGIRDSNKLYLENVKYLNTSLDNTRRIDIGKLNPPVRAISS